MGTAKVIAPRLTWAARIVLAIAGLAGFFWIGYEDRSLISVLAVAAILAAAGGMAGLKRWVAGERLAEREWLLKCAGTGMLAGGAVTPLAALLITLKVSLHNHPLPEFGLADLTTVLRRTPVWIAAGLMFGLCGGLLGLGLARTRDGDPAGMSPQEQEPGLE